MNRAFARLGLRAIALAVVLLHGACMTPETVDEEASKPTILLSLDRTWWHRLGLSRWTYVRSVKRAGARVRVFDYAAASAGEDPGVVAKRLLRGVDGLVLSGGGDVDPLLYGGDAEESLAVRPERDRFELALLEEAMNRRLPVLGICRGAQLLNVARGGTLVTIRSDEVLRRRHGRLRGHRVELEPESRLARLFGTERIERVVSYHGQAVGRPGEGLVVVGRSADDVAEAIELATEDQGQWSIGVQWHPELSPRSPLQRKLFSALVEAARSVQSAPAG
jgi:putative glutamine amidotransferase